MCFIVCIYNYMTHVLLLRQNITLISRCVCIVICIASQLLWWFWGAHICKTQSLCVALFSVAEIENHCRSISLSIPLTVPGQTCKRSKLKQSCMFTVPLGAIFMKPSSCYLNWIEKTTLAMPDAIKTEVPLGKYSSMRGTRKCLSCS